jgi:hypothetical protein
MIATNKEDKRVFLELKPSELGNAYHALNAQIP